MGRHPRLVPMVFLVLAAQYESWTVPFAVLLAVPLAVFGALAGQLLRGLDNNVYAQIGLVMFCCIFGCDRDRILNQRWDTASFWQQGLLDQARRTLETGVSSRDEGEIVTEDGRIVRIDWQFVRFFRQTEAHLLCLVGDITEQKRAQSLIGARMPDLVCFKDGQGRWLEANAFTQNLFGLTPKEYLGKTDCDLAEALEPFRDTFFLCDKSDRLAWHSGKMVRCEEAMGGRLVVDSEPGKGSVFSFTAVFGLERLQDVPGSRPDVP